MTGSGEDPLTTPFGDPGAPYPDRYPPRGRAARSAWPRGSRAIAGVACLLAMLALAGAGCSSKPARKKGRSKAAAAREREERPLVEEPARSEPSGMPSTADAPLPAAEPAQEATPADGAGARDTPVVESPPTDTPPPASLGERVDQGSGGNGPRPTSPLVDPDTAIPLDGGRVEICSPVGWTRSPRSANYLVRYQPGPRKTFPSIVVTAEPSPAGLDSVATSNQAALVAAIAAKLAETFPADGPVKLIKKPAAATFGSHPGVAWAMPGTAKVGGLSEPIERFAYGVVLGGRLYTVETRAPKGKLDDDAKAAAKAVAATLFRPEGAPAGQPEAAAIPPGAEPAATPE